MVPNLIPEQPVIPIVTKKITKKGNEGAENGFTVPLQ